MNFSLPSILLSLGGKCLLNWGLVFLQRNLICRSFLGVFSISLAVVDTLLTLFATTLHLQGPDGCVHLLDMKLTTYHVCLLVQILGQVYNALQWPVAVVAFLDHFFTITRRLQLSRFSLLLSLSLWFLAVFYVFLLSDFTPVMEDVTFKQIRQCWVFFPSQFVQVASFLILALSFAGLQAWRRLLKTPQKDQSVVHPALSIFLNTWACFVALLLVLLLLPAYLALNVAWLCFLNSLLITVVLCAVCPASQQTQGLAAAPVDYFCEWRFKFSLAAEDRT